VGRGGGCGRIGLAEAALSCHAYSEGMLLAGRVCTGCGPACFFVKVEWESDVFFNCYFTFTAAGNAPQAGHEVVVVSGVCGLLCGLDQCRWSGWGSACGALGHRSPQPCLDLPGCYVCLCVESGGGGGTALPASVVKCCGRGGLVAAALCTF